MELLKSVLETLSTQNLEEYKEIMDYCSKRVYEDEGIPAIVGLDDISSAYDTVYEVVEEDKNYHFLGAAAVLIFTYLYSSYDEEMLKYYPAIAPAMSAVAEKMFHQLPSGEIMEFRSITKIPYKY